jgi:PAS domain S-box-containing protein
MKIKGDQHKRLTQNINRLIKELHNLQKSADALEQVKLELQKSEEGFRRLAAIVHDSNDALTMLDFNGNILAWNRGAERIYGWSEKDALKMKHRDILPESNKGEVSVLVKKLKRGETVESFETKRLTKDQNVLDVWLTATLLTNDKGKPVAIATTERDITERKKEKEELRRLKDYCEIEVEKKTKALITAKEKATRNEKLVDLGKLAGSIGHELKNPLHVIRMNMYLLHKYMDEGVEYDKIKNSLEVIDESIDESTRIIDNILAFSRTKEPRLTEVDMRQIINKSIKKLKIPQNIDVIREIPQRLPSTMADELQMTLVFSNIIKNAFDAMPEGGILTVNGNIEDGMLKIQVTDTGSGITRENKEKIFDSLFSTKNKGTGLGLSFCKSIVAAHQGNMEVRSKVDQGTTFIIKLPVIRTNQS